MNTELKIIKRPLIVGEILSCRNGWGHKYKATVVSVNGNEAEVSLLTALRNKPIGSIWKVGQNRGGNNTSWDGMIETTSGWYGSNRVSNNRTGGSWLYSTAITNWKNIIGR